MARTIVVLPGDGIGPEVVAAALKILETCRSRISVEIDIVQHPIGGAALDRLGEPLPEFVLQDCLQSGVVLLGAVGDPRFDGNPPERRPEKALLRLRQQMELFANLRPIHLSSALLDSSPLRREIIEGTDILFVRELTGGIYFGEPRGRRYDGPHEVAFNTEVYSDFEVERIARVAFEAAAGRRKLVTSVDKSNVLESSQLWREVVVRVAEDYPDIELRHILVDNCAMQLVANPRQFDVVLTNNMFGDILSDEAAMITGSIGMLPSASLGTVSSGIRAGLFEPVHGSAPDIAGKGLANPLATIQSLALLLRHSLQEEKAAADIEAAVDQLLKSGIRTTDLARDGEEAANTDQVVDELIGLLS